MKKKEIQYRVESGGSIYLYSTPEAVYNHIIGKMYPLVIGRRAPQSVFDAAEMAEKWCKSAITGSTYSGSVIGKSFTINAVKIDDNIF